jgi:hypothetical protein
MRGGSSAFVGARFVKHSPTIGDQALGILDGYLDDAVRADSRRLLSACRCGVGGGGRTRITRLWPIDHGDNRKTDLVDEASAPRVRMRRRAERNNIFWLTAGGYDKTPGVISSR